jgi:hypothetical protein
MIPTKTVGCSKSGAAVSEISSLPSPSLRYSPAFVYGFSATQERAGFSVLPERLAMVQTICKRTTRTSAAQADFGGTSPPELITQRSLVQIQPAQRAK